MIPASRPTRRTLLRGTLALMGASLGATTQAQTAPVPAPLPRLARLNPASFDIAGWAARTQGGRGGRILRVTTLAPEGPGSLREALEAEGPRIVVFEVGGVIDMGGRNLRLKHPYITIAGQTAPSPGISVIKTELMVATHDVIVQHLRFRPGEFGRPKKGGGDQDGLSTVGGAYNVIVDHCSFSWATDENLSASGPRFDGATPADWRRATSHDVTYSHNLIYESLSHSVHEKGEHSKGSLIHDNTSGILLFGNVYVSNRERNALFKGGAQGAMVNNLIFNPGRRAVHYNLLANEWSGQPYQVGRLALVGNVLRHGPDTPADTPLFTMLGDAELQLHLRDNLAFDAGGKPVPQVREAGRPGARVLADEAPLLPPDLQVYPAQRLEADLPAVVGARPWDRDALDARVLADMAAGRGRIIDSETENALGYPRHAPTRRAFVEAEWDLATMAPKAGWAALALPAPAAR
ncbi:MAG: pectate lyase [Burkholderiales bacterium]|nr:pectate lyase [Burkholderiales bacterium]